MLVGMPYKVVVVDENNAELIPSLQGNGIRVITVNKGDLDEDIKKSKILEGRILITDNADDFKKVSDIRKFGYALILTDKLKFIDSDTSIKNKTTALILKAMRKFGLWAKMQSFIVSLKEGEEPVYTEVNLKKKKGAAYG